MNAPVVSLQGIHVAFTLQRKRIPVLRDLHLEIGPGDRLVLFGPSGCGKTTLLHLLALLNRPDQGLHLMEGTEVGRLHEDARADLRARRIGLVFQSFHLLPYHTVRENIRLRARYLRNTPPPQPEREEAVLEQVGLRGLARHPARFLSGGEQQRLCIARALLHRPSLFLADEPTGNLDQGHAEQVRELFAGLPDETAVVVATHDTRWLAFATRICHFGQGALKEEP